MAQLSQIIYIFRVLLELIDNFDEGVTIIEYDIYALVMLFVGN